MHQYGIERKREGEIRDSRAHIHTHIERRKRTERERGREREKEREKERERKTERDTHTHTEREHTWLGCGVAHTRHMVAEDGFTTVHSLQSHSPA